MSAAVHTETLRGVAVEQRTTEPTRTSRVVRDLLLAALVVAVAGAAAFVVAARESERYGARTELLYDTTAAQSSQQADTALGTQVELAQSRDVLNAAADDLTLPIDEVEAAVSVQRVSGSELLRITATSSSRREARLLADAVAAHYLDSLATLRPQNSAELEFLQNRIATLTERQSEQRARLAELEADRLAAATPVPASAEERQLDASLTTDAARVSELQQRVTEIELAQVAQTQARVVSPAFVLAEPVAPKPLQKAVLGVLAGLVVAAVLLWVLAARRRRTTSSDSDAR